MQWLHLKPQGSVNESNAQGQTEGAWLVMQNSLGREKKNITKMDDVRFEWAW